MRHLRTHKVASSVVLLGVAVLAVVAVMLQTAQGDPTAAAAAPGAVTGADAGINLGGAGNSAFPSFSAAQQRQIMSAIAASGIRAIRIDVPFVDEEPEPGQFDWTVADEVQRARAVGLAVDAVIDYPPAWARQSDGSPNRSDFAAFSASAATALWGLGVHTFEIENEPNLAQFWGAAVSPAGYAALLVDTDTQVHRAEPTATVVAAGLAETALRGAAGMAPLPFLQSMYRAGIHGHFDALADHPYTFPAAPAPGDPGNAFGALTAMRALMVSNGDGGKKIWLTEYGAPTAGAGAVSLRQQATLISDAFAVAFTRAWIGPVFIFDWEDDGPDGAFGLLTSSGAHKPAYGAVAAAARRAGS